MISYDKAKQLKELGLKWNPKCGDWYKVEHWPIAILLTGDTMRLFNEEIKDIFERISKNDNNVWLPSLKQLLDKIKEYNWTYALYSENEIEIETRIEHVPIIDRHRNFEGKIIEDIIADALIYILEREKEKKI